MSGSVSVCPSKQMRQRCNASGVAGSSAAPPEVRHAAGKCTSTATCWVATTVDAITAAKPRSAVLSTVYTTMRLRRCVYGRGAARADRFWRRLYLWLLTRLRGMTLTRV